MRPTLPALRALAVPAAALALWASIDWLSAPRMPFGSGKDLGLFPLLAIAINGVLRGLMPPWVGSLHYLLVCATLILASGLSLRLAWLSGTSIAARRLGVALALAAMATAFFWLIRDMAPWQPWLRPWLPWLDPAATALGALSLVALVGCFRDYPEPLTQEFANRGLIASLDWQDQHAASKRAGRGLWRLWSWLPPEHYGIYGRTQRAGLRGWQRMLRSREAVWVGLALAIFGYGFWLAGWFGEAKPGPRVLLMALVSMAAVVLGDPVAAARFDTGALSFIRRRMRSALTSGELTLHRWLGSVPGVIVIAACAAGVAWLWRRGGPMGGVLAGMIMMGYVLLLFGHALSLLSLNWRHGLAEHRRAIGWIFLGTAGVIIVWLAAVSAVGLFGLGHWLTGGESKRLLGITVVLGPPAIAFAFVSSLWASTLHRGSFDPALALRRGTGVALAGVLLTTVFVALEGVLTSQAVVHLGMPSASGAVIAGTLTALLVAPARKHVDRQVQRAVLRWLPPEALAAAKREQGVIAFSDLSGYTRLSETDQDEALTLAALLHRCAREQAEAQGGRVVKSLGDAVLCVYPDPARALAAVAALHRRYRDESDNRGLEYLPLHSGMHFGEWVVSNDGDVFGASVNLTARLQGLAGPDEVALTESLAPALKEAGFVAEALPARRFKNIGEPIDCFRFRVGADR
jgi:adenylate cyclase